MKKKLTGLIAAAIFALSLPTGFAANNTEAETMEKALINVKSKVEIPAELTEFSSGSYNNGYNDIFNFNWRDKESGDGIYISCDSEGRISEYSYNRRRDEDAPSYLGVGAKEVKAYSQVFLEKLVPDAFSDTHDTLKFEKYTVDNYGNRIGYRLI